MAEPPEWSHPALLEAGRGTVAPDWIDYHAEATVGDEYRVLGRVLGHSTKKLHYLFYMENLSRQGLAATHEEIALHVELARRRSSPLPPQGLARIEALEAAQAALPRPTDLGRVISL